MIEKLRGITIVVACCLCFPHILSKVLLLKGLKASIQSEDLDKQ